MSVPQIIMVFNIFLYKMMNMTAVKISTCAVGCPESIQPDSYIHKIRAYASAYASAFCSFGGGLLI